MSAIEAQVEPKPALASRIALVRAQLAPIRSRQALLDSYRRESLYRLASPASDSESAFEILDIAYALCWADLAPEEVATETGDCL